MKFIDPLKLSKAETTKQPKYKLMFPETRSSFKIVRCGTCAGLTVCFSHSQSVRSCDTCGFVIMTPRGGKAVVSEGCAVKLAKKHFSELASEE